MVAPAGIYPFSTRDGKAIPLDIIKPLGVLVKSFVVGESALFVVPADATVAVIHTSTPCFIRFGGDLLTTLLDGVLMEDTLYIPEATTIITSVEAGNAYVRDSGEAGTIYVQFIQKWAGLALNDQYNKK